MPNELLAATDTLYVVYSLSPDRIEEKWLVHYYGVSLSYPVSLLDGDCTCTHIDVSV